MSSAQYDEDWQLSTGMGSELCILSSRMQNACSKKVYDTVHEYCVILGSMQTYQAVFEYTEPNMHNAFHRIFPSFTYQATTPRAQEFNANATLFSLLDHSDSFKLNKHPEK